MWLTVYCCDDIQTVEYHLKTSKLR